MSKKRTSRLKVLRKAAFGLLGLWLISGPLSAWAAVAAANVEDANFEGLNDADSAATAGWDSVDAGFVNAEVDDETTVATADGTRQMWFNGGDSDDDAERDFTAQTGDVVFECLIYITENDTEIGLVLERSTGADVCELQFDGNTANILVSSNTTLTDTGANWAINTWYRVRMEYDRSAATYDVFIDNVLIADDYGDDTTNDVGRLHFYMANDNDDQSVFLDDIEVYTQRKWIGTTSSAWNTTSNWTMLNEGVPDVTEAVRFTDGDLVTNQPQLDSGRSVASVMIDDDNYGPNDTSIQMNGQTLTNTGALDVDAGGTLAVGSGTITVAGATDLNGTMTISTGLCDAEGAWDGTGGTITFSGAGDLKLAGAVTAVADTFTASTGEVTYDGAAAQTVDNLTYYDLTINKNASTASLSGTTVVGHNLQVSTTSGTVTLDLNGQTLDLDSSGTNNVDSSCVLEVDAAADLRFENNAALSIDDGGTLKLAGTDMSANVATVTTSGTVGTHGYTIDINGGADFDFAILESLDVAASGLTLDDATAGETHDMDIVVFRSEVNSAGAWFTITGSQWNGVTINSISLEAGPTTSISKTVAGANTTVADYADEASWIGPAQENDTNNNLVWSLETAVELLDFHATGYDAGVALFWRTALEKDNLGFNLLRAEPGTGVYSQINPSLVMGLGNSLTGGWYYFLDETAETGKTYSYFLEDVELGGQKKLHGPVSGSRAPGTALDLTQGGTLPPGGYAAHGATSDPGGGAGGQGGGGSGPGTPPRLSSLLSGDEVHILGQRLSRDGQDLEVIVEILPPAAPLRVEMLEGEAHLRIEIPGWPSVSVPGRPEVPEKTFFLPLPEADEVDVEFLEGRSRFEMLHIGDVLPAPGPAHRKMTQPELDAILEAARRAPGQALTPEERRQAMCRDLGRQAREGTGRRQRGPDYFDPHFYPRTAAAFGGYHPLGGETLFALTAHPVQVQSQQRVLRRYSRIVARIRLRGVHGPGEPPPDGVQINPAAQQESWKVVCTEEGMHRLPYESLGWTAPVISSKLALSYDGRPVAIEVADGGDGMFGPGDSIVFFARAVKEGPYGPYTDEAVYWLAVGTADGLRMQAAALPPTGVPTAQPDFPQHVRWEQDNIENTNIANGEERDNAFWAIAFTELIGPPVEGVLAGVSQAPGQGLVRISLQGLTYDDDVAPDHHAVVKLNGTQIADMHFDGATLSEVQVAVDQALFTAGTNAFEFQMPQDTGADFDAVYVERLDLTYRRTYAASGGRLLFSTQLGGDYTVTGFPAGVAGLYDITDPARPQVVQGHVASGGSLLLGVPAGARRFAAEESAAFLTPVRVEANAPSSLGVRGQRYDYLLVTHGDFRAEAERLADHRRALGMQVLVADVQDVYDEFSGGHFTPNAVRDFLRFAWRGYAAPAPQYCLLMGDATFRYRNPPGGPVNYVPTKIVVVGGGDMEAPSDNLLADVQGADAVPEIYLGRFPVSTAAEAAAMVDKVIAYETTGDGGTGFTGRATHVAGDGNGVAAFETTVDALVAQLPASVQPGTIKMRVTGAGPGTAALQSALDQGSAMVTYLGHGAVDLWGSDTGATYLWASQAAGVQNGPAQYFLCVFNCLNGFYLLEDPVSLGEAMAKAPARGAIAVWSSTAVTPIDHQRVIAVELGRLVFQQNVRQIGKATSLAKALAAANPNYRDIANAWILFGDPALVLKLP